MRKSHCLFATVIVLSIVYAIPLGGQPAKKNPFVELKYTAGQITDTKIDYDGLNRRYLYYTPKNFNPKAKHPLIFILHGFNQPVETIVSGYSAMQAKADADGTILIYPVATGTFEKKSLTRNDIVWLKVVNGGHWLPTYADGKALDASNLNGFDGSYMGNLNCDYMASEGIYEFLLSYKREK